MITQGQRLKKIRQALNLTQTELGKPLNMSKQYFSKAETDLLLLNNKQLSALCIDYNVNINYLLTGYGQMFNYFKKKSNRNEILSAFDKILQENGI